MNSTLTPTGMESRTWNGVEIQRRPTDGFVNATAMCKAYGKLFNDYGRLDRTTQYLQALSRSTGNPVDLLIQMITTGPNHLRGTWVHPRIAVDLARWLHPEFAVWMDGWFLESLIPRITADPTPAPAPLPQQPLQPRQLGAWEVGGPGVNVPHAELLSRQLTEILDAYTLQTLAEQEALPQEQRSRSHRYTRVVALHFLEWFVTHHGQLVFSTAPVGMPAAAVAAPPRPPAPAPAAPAPGPRPPRQHQAPPATPQPPQPVQQQQDGYHPGDLITGPELAHLLGLDAHSINKWAAARSTGAERNGWRLIGRGKLSAGKQQCSVYPPGCASWLFMKL